MDEIELTIIKKKIEDHEKRISILENQLKDKKEMNITPSETGSNIERLASKLNISTDKLQEIYDIEKETLTVLKFAGEMNKEKTQNIALLTLLGYKYFFNQEELLSQEIRRNVAENGVALNNFATYLNELAPSLVRRKGEMKSPKTTYKLTVLGESKARELLKSIIGD